MRRRSSLGSRHKLLKERLVAWWEWDEASNQWQDMRGGHQPTTIQAVTRVAGRANQYAAHFTEVDSSYIEVPDTADLSPVADAFATGIIWRLWEARGDSNQIALINKYVRTGDQREFNVHYIDYNWFNNTVPTYLQVSSNGSSLTAEVSLFSQLAPFNTDWRFSFGHSGQANVNLRLNNGVLKTTAFAGPMFSGTSPVRFGRYEKVAAEGGGAWYGKHEIDSVQLWIGYVPTEEEWAWLYNNGFGRRYMDLLLEGL